MKLEKLDATPKEMLRFVARHLDEKEHAFSTDAGHQVVAQFEDNDYGHLGHVVIFHPDRVASIEEVLEIRNTLFPGNCEVMIVLPRKEQHQHLLQNGVHLWEMPFTWDRM